MENSKYQINVLLDASLHTINVGGGFGHGIAENENLSRCHWYNNKQ